MKKSRRLWMFYWLKYDVSVAGWYDKVECYMDRRLFGCVFVVVYEFYIIM